MYRLFCEPRDPELRINSAPLPGLSNFFASASSTSELVSRDAATDTDRELASLRAYVSVPSITNN